LDKAQCENRGDERKERKKEWIARATTPLLQWYAPSKNKDLVETIPVPPKKTHFKASRKLHVPSQCNNFPHTIA